MPRSMLAFAISAAIVLTTETSYSAPQAHPKPTRPAAATVARRPVTKKPVRPLSAVQQTLRRDPILAARIGGQLPAGTNLMTASAGFRNLGQFVAAVNASNNLAIPFGQLKRRIVNDGMPLGSAIQDVRPTTDYRSAARRAEDEAASLVNR
jgi:hypothetical protein